MIEDVHRRDKASVATQDHVLDLWVEPDRKVRWKDEDELVACVVAGRYTADQAGGFRADVRDVEEMVASW